jgi:hypothetical protein
VKSCEPLLGALGFGRCAEEESGPDSGASLRVARLCMHACIHPEYLDSALCRRG